MADEFSVNIHGAAEVTRALYQFSDRLGDRVTLLALRSGANYMLKQIRQAAPVKTGRLKRSIKTSQSKIHTRRRDGVVGVYITVKAGKSRKDPKGAWYGRFIENGYKRKNGTTITGKRFVSSTFNSSKEAATTLIINNIEQAGQQLARQIGFTS